MTDLRQRIASGSPLLLDGGLATSLEARGFDLDHGLGSARLLDQDPGAILDVHRAFVAAGAECVITATYQAPASPTARLELAVRLARESGARFVAASIGPYGASLADGSEYTGDYPAVDLRAWHERRFGFLAACDIDALACETIPNIEEATALAELVLPEVPTWFSFSCRDGRHLRDGTPIRDAVLIVAPMAVAVGVNCTAPRFVDSLIDEIRAATDKPIVVYPNSGEEYDAKTRSWSGKSTFLEHAAGWLDRGVRIIGGCCRVGPDAIRTLAERIG